MYIEPEKKASKYILQLYFLSIEICQGFQKFDDECFELFSKVVQMIENEGSTPKIQDTT